MANELLEMVLDEIPDAFRRQPGTAVDKMKAFVEFYRQQAGELQDCYGALADSLGRPLKERIRLLMKRANDEAAIAVKLRNRLEEIAPGKSSDI